MLSHLLQTPSSFCNSCLILGYSTKISNNDTEIPVACSSVLFKGQCLFLGIDFQGHLFHSMGV